MKTQKLPIALPQSKDLFYERKLYFDTAFFLQSCSLYSILLFANVFMLQWCKQEELLTSKEIKKI